MRILCWLAGALIALAGGCTCGADHSASLSDAASTLDGTLASRSRDTARAILGELIIESGEALSEEDERYLGRRLGRSLVESGLFLASEEAARTAGYYARPATLRLALSFDVLEQGSTGSPALVAAMETTLAWPDGQVFLRENVLGELGLRVTGDAKRAGLESAHATETLKQVVAGLLAKERLRLASDDELLGVLGPTTDPELLVWALQLVGERRIPEAVSAVAPLLKNGTKAVRDAAITTLVATRDPSAVAPLADFAEFSDYMAVRTVIEAVSALGGTEAAEYLEFVATGHPDTGIRNRAKAALERVQRRLRLKP